MIYLSGPIQGRPANESIAWRQLATKLLAPIPTLDPTRFDYQKHYGEPGIDKIIVESDLKDIGDSCALLVMFDRPSAGTMMEICLAKTIFYLPVFVVDISGQPRSPWLTYHATQFFGSLEEACAYICIVFGG
jgi:hypothetical protein